MSVSEHAATCAVLNFAAFSREVNAETTVADVKDSTVGVVHVRVLNLVSRPAKEYLLIAIRKVRGKGAYLRL